MILDEVLQALRALRRGRSFTILAAAILTVGIGLTLFMFGAIDAFLLRPLPYRDAGRLLHVELSDPARDRSSLEVPYVDFVDWKKTLASFEDFGAFYEGTVNLADRDEPERLDGTFVTPEVFAILGVRPALGRGFAAGDVAPGAPTALVLSDWLWRRRYAADPAVLGRAVRVNGAPATIVGVMPAGFTFPYEQEAWVTIPAEAAGLARDKSATVEVLGHLAPGRSIAAAAAELDAALARQSAADPAYPRGLRSVVKPFAQEFVGRRTSSQLSTMFAAVVLVLLIACADVANLLLARGLARRPALAVRAALGASRARLVLHGMVEAVVIAATASVAGLALAQWAGERTLDLARASETMDIPTWVHFALDGRSIAFTLGVVAVSALLAGLGPAFASTRFDVQRELRQAARGASSGRARAGRMLVVAQIALCCGLVTAAGLAARGVQLLREASVGVDGDRVLGGRVALFEQAYPDDAARLAFYARAEERLRALPGVESATITSSLPGSFVGGDWIEVEGQTARPEDRHLAQIARVTPSYFDTVGVRLLAGRNLAATDGAGDRRVAVVNRRLVDALLPAGEPIGRRIRFASQDGSEPWWTIVGVAPDLQQDRVDNELQPTFYVPLAQDVPSFAFLALRAAPGQAAALAPALRKAITELDPDMPVYYLRTVAEWVSTGRFGAQFLASLFGFFALAGLVLAAAGVYGLAAHGVLRRAGEIGLRRALGAADGAIVRLVVGRGLADLAWGLALGAGIAAALARPVASFFYGVRAFDPAVFLAVPAVLLVAALAAALAPTRRAVRIDPATALRQEG
ncbi:MAG: ADOP family duplicated permease [Thermoanaerobaculia bacterium]